MIIQYLYVVERSQVFALVQNDFVVDPLLNIVLKVNKTFCKGGVKCRWWLNFKNSVAGACFLHHIHFIQIAIPVKIDIWIESLVDTFFPVNGIRLQEKDALQAWFFLIAVDP